VGFSKENPMRAATRWLHAIVLGTVAALPLAPARSASSDAPRTTRDELNLGYSLLHEQADGLSKLKWIVALKKDSDSFEQTVKPVIAYYAELAEALEALDAKYPSVHLNLKAMPEFLGKARANMVDARIKEIVPIVGESGMPYERTVLLMLMYALEEQRNVVSAMAEREPEPGLARFLRDTRQQLDRHLQDVNSLLNRKYFTQPTKKD
jgi:hypothetical protein